MAAKYLSAEEVLRRALNGNSDGDYSVCLSTLPVLFFLCFSEVHGRHVPGYF